jgi:sulfide:quinone oxidoreductase
MNSKTIVVLGAGIGGTVAATRLRKALPREHRVIEAEREAARSFQPSLLWLMTGARTLEAISRPVSRLARRGIEVVRGEVEAIDPGTRRVTVASREIAADYVVVALRLRSSASGSRPGRGRAQSLHGRSAEGLRQALSRLRQDGWPCSSPASRSNVRRRPTGQPC